jgi:hypothetical protein
MSHVARLVCCAALVSLPLLVAGAVRPTLLEEFGIDPSGWATSLGNFGYELERQEQLKRQLHEIQTAMQLKSELCRDLIAGRVSLAQTTRRFCELAGRPREEFLELIRREFPGETEEETLCRHVIAWVCNRLDDDPVKQDAVRRRLEAEMQELLRTLPGAERGDVQSTAPAPPGFSDAWSTFFHSVL